MVAIEKQGYELNKPVYLPQLTETDILLIIQQASKLFSEEPIILNISHDIICVGDLHGHIFDLFRIFNHYGLPPFNRYLFHGDIVDRGEFSVETLVLLLLLKIQFPDYIYIIRGNHEFETINSVSGLLEEVKSTYSSTVIFNEMNSLFNLFPFGARIYDKIFSIHGGIGPSFLNLKNIESIEKPVETFDSPILSPAVWSDPSPETNGFLSSPRGQGFLYGEDAADAFFNQNHINVLIRAHQCVEGVSILFHQHLYTVFSASNYCGQCSNKAGIIYIALIDPSTVSNPVPVVLQQSHLSNGGLSLADPTNDSPDEVENYNSLPPLKGYTSFCINHSMLEESINIPVPQKPDEISTNLQSQIEAFKAEKMNSAKSSPHVKINGPLASKQKPVPKARKNHNPSHKKASSVNIGSSSSSPTSIKPFQPQKRHPTGNFGKKPPRASIALQSPIVKDIESSLSPPTPHQPQRIEYGDGRVIEITPQTFPPLKYLFRKDVSFCNSIPE